jgi:hypothetical protein
MPATLCARSPGWNNTESARQWQSIEQTAARSTGGINANIIAAK